MKLYLKQKVFSIGDKFFIYDENGEEKYRVEGEIFSFGKKMHVYDLKDREVAFIHQKVMSFLPHYYIERNGVEIAQIVKKLTLFYPKYEIQGLNWTIDGDFFDHEYIIKNGDRTVVSVSKQWLTWGDTYEIDIALGEDEINALCTALIIDACLESKDD
jgi:uncharacterized protein YxjI